jgi:antitoxin FitA
VKASFAGKPMTQLTVRNVSEQMVRALKQRAAAHGRSAEAEHREILREVLLEREEDFATRAKALRQRLRSTVDSSEIIRAERDRDATA